MRVAVIGWSADERRAAAWRSLRLHARLVTPEERPPKRSPYPHPLWVFRTPACRSCATDAERAPPRNAGGTTKGASIGRGHISLPEYEEAGAPAAAGSEDASMARSRDRLRRRRVAPRRSTFAPASPVAGRFGAGRLGWPPVRPLPLGPRVRRRARSGAADSRRMARRPLEGGVGYTSSGGSQVAE